MSFKLAELPALQAAARVEGNSRREPVGLPTAKDLLGPTKPDDWVQSGCLYMRRGWNGEIYTRLPAEVGVVMCETEIADRVQVYILAVPNPRDPKKPYGVRVLPLARREGSGDLYARILDAASYRSPEKHTPGAWYAQNCKCVGDKEVSFLAHNAEEGELHTVDLVNLEWKIEKVQVSIEPVQLWGCTSYRVREEP